MLSYFYTECFVICTGQQKAASILQNPKEALQNAKRAYPQLSGDNSISKKLKVEKDSSKNFTTINERDLKMDDYQSKLPLDSES